MNYEQIVKEIDKLQKQQDALIAPLQEARDKLESQLAGSYAEAVKTNGFLTETTWEFDECFRFKLTATKAGNLDKLYKFFKAGYHGRFWLQTGDKNPEYDFYPQGTAIVFDDGVYLDFCEQKEDKVWEFIKEYNLELDFYLMKKEIKKAEGKIARFVEIMGKYDDVLLERKTK